MLGEDVDWSLAKYDIEKVFEPEQELLIPNNFTLYPVYPNPFNMETIISFDLPGNYKINLKIYDIRGREVWSWPLNNAELQAGNYRVAWKAINNSGYTLSSGMYLIKLWSGEYHSTQKVILIK